MALPLVLRPLIIYSNEELKMNLLWKNSIFFAQQYITGTILSICGGVLLFTNSLNAAVPARGAEILWTTYEAEDMATNGDVIGPTYNRYIEATEGSGKKAVKLITTSQHVEFTAKGTANTIIVRYNIPDAASGNGIDATLSLYKNGTFVQKIPVTSRFSHLYGNYPWTNDPAAGSHKGFFDEAQLKVDTIRVGDVIRLQKDATDNAPYYIIDLVDLENVAPPATMPNGFLSLTDYGAVPDDDNADTDALQNAITAAKAQGKSVWIPAGVFRIGGTISLDNITIKGAGMWHSKFLGLDDYADGKRLYFTGSGNNIHLSDFSLFGKLNYRNDSEGNDGIVGSYGTGSTIKNIWVEHTKTGAWITNSDNLRIEGMRFRNTIADGINLCTAMRNTLVYNCTSRNTGDDCFAMWPTGSGTYQPGFNVFKNNTAVAPWLAHGFAIYGGESNRVEDCVIKDVGQGAGILISTTFPATGFTGTTVVQRNEIIGSGGDDNSFSWRGALQIMADRLSISGVKVNNLTITDAVSDGIKFQSNGSSQITNVTIDSVTIQNAGKRGSGYGITENPGVQGNATISNTTITSAASGPVLDQSASFTLRFISGSSDNIAIGKTISASSSTNVTFSASNVNDSDLSSYWESNNNVFPQSVTVDLGEKTNIGKVVLKLPVNWETRIQTLSVQESSDGTSFTDIVTSKGYTFDPSSGNSVKIEFAATSAQYIRLQITGNTAWQAAQLAEFVVSAAKDNPTSLSTSGFQTSKTGDASIQLSNAPNGKITISILKFAPGEKVTVTVYNLKGQAIYRNDFKVNANGSKKVTMNTGHVLPKGSYMIVARGNKTRVQSISTFCK